MEPTSREPLDGSRDDVGSSWGELAVSIIMPTRNRLPLLLRQVAAVRRQRCTRPWELIVVDNGSTDGTQAAITAIHNADARVRLLEATERADAAYARNSGAAGTSAPLLAFIDDDDVVGERWLQALLDALDEHELVASNMEYDVLNTPDVMDGWPLTGRDRLLSVDGRSVSTGHVGIRRDLWDRLGGQTEGLTVGEDMEMTVRAGAEFGAAPFLATDATYHRQLPTALRGAYRQGRRDGRGRIEVTLQQRGLTATLTTTGRWLAARLFWLATRLPAACAGRRRFLWSLRCGELVGTTRALINARHGPVTPR